MSSEQQHWQHVGSAKNPAEKHMQPRQSSWLPVRDRIAIALESIIERLQERGMTTSSDQRLWQHADSAENSIQQRSEQQRFDRAGVACITPHALALHQCSIS